MVTEQLEAPRKIETTPVRLDRRRLGGKVALVTGGCRGIGAAITDCLAEAGAHVAAGYHRGAEVAEAMAARCAEHGPSMSVHQGNVAEPEACQRVVDEVLAQHGRIDFLVNNAGINLDKTVRKMSVDDWHAVLRVNLSGGFYMVKAVLDHMLARGSGRIVNMDADKNQRRVSRNAALEFYL